MTTADGEKDWKRKLDSMAKTIAARFPARTGRIKALVRKPRQVCGAVVLLHGLCVDRDEFDDMYVDLAAALADVDIASLRFDFAGHGGRKKEWREFSIVEQFSETCAAVEWLSREFDLRPRRVRICGTSFGAPPAIFTARTMTDVVDRIALISPVLDYRATFLDPVCPWGRDNFGPEAIRAAQAAGRLLVDGKQPLPARLFDEMELIDPLDALLRIAATALIVHGASDSMVPVGPAREAAKSRNVRYLEEKEMDHGPFHREDENGDSQESAILRKTIIGRVTEHLASGL